MKYHGNNPVGLALATDKNAEVRDRLLHILEDHRMAAEQGNSTSSPPATYQRNLASADCAVLCAGVVKEFHAVCVSTSAEHDG